MSSDNNATELLSRSMLRVWPECYLMVKLPPRLTPEVSRLLSATRDTFSMMTANAEELSILIEEGLWSECDLKPMKIAEDGPYKVISIDAITDLNVVGYLAPVLKRLSEGGIRAFANCAFSSVHLIVKESDIDATLSIISNFIELCKHHVD